MAWVAVVEVIEDNLPSPHLLILVEMFFVQMLSVLWHIYEVLYVEQTILPGNPSFALPCPENSGVWKVHFHEEFVGSSSARTPIVAHDISSRCGMWEVVLILMLFLTFLSLLWGCRQYPRCSRGAFSVAFTTSVPPHNRAAWHPALLPSLLGQSGGMLSFMLSKAGGHQAQSFRGRVLHVMHNSWPLWTFQLRPLSLMGNPNGDLFIKTISWLFVVPASHKGATIRPSIITHFFGFSMPVLHFDYIAVCQLIHQFCHTLTLITGFMIHYASLSFLLVICPTFPLFLYLQLPIPLPFPSPLSWVHPHAVTLNLNI